MVRSHDRGFSVPPPGGAASSATSRYQNVARLRKLHNFYLAAHCIFVRVGLPFRGEAAHSVQLFQVRRCLFLELQLGSPAGWCNSRKLRPWAVLAAVSADERPDTVAVNGFRSEACCQSPFCSFFSLLSFFFLFEWHVVPPCRLGHSCQSPLLTHI